MSALDLLTRIRAAVRTPLYRNECLQVDRVWHGSLSFWVNLLSGWLITWGFALGLFWMAGSVWWLAAVPAVFLLTQLVSWCSAPDMSILLSRERRDGTLESLVLTTADRQDLLWGKLVAGIRPQLAISLLYVPMGVLAGDVVLLHIPKFHAEQVWGCSFGGLLFGAFIAVASLGGCLAAGAAGTLAALSRRGYMGQIIMSITLTVPLGLLDLVCVMVPAAGMLAAWRHSLLASPMTHAEANVIANALVSVGLPPNLLESMGLPTLLFCSAALFALRLLVLNLWLPTWLMRRCAERFDERLLSEE